MPGAAFAFWENWESGGRLILLRNAHAEQSAADPAAFEIIDQEQEAGESPADGVADQRHGEGAELRRDEGDPRDAQHADAEYGGFKCHLFCSGL